MKRVRINKGKIGLVYKNKDYKKTIEEGSNWIGFFEKVMEYDLTKPFIPITALDILLKDEELRKQLVIIEVADNEIAILYEKGNFQTLLSPGRYAYWNSLLDYNYTKIDLSKVEITEKIDLSTRKRSELVPYIRLCKIESYEEGLLFIDNKFNTILKPGEYYFWKNAIAINVQTVDMRRRQLEVIGQEILTKDKAALRINFFAQFKVIDIEKAMVQNKDFEKQLYVLMQLALREFIGALGLDELLENRESISNYVLATLKEKSNELGLMVLDSGVKDIILPGEVKDIMNQVLIAQKKAQANVITRREETASTRSLLNTAKLMEDNKMLFKLKEMEYVEKIAEKIGELSLSVNGQVIDQLKSVFSRSK